MQVANVKPTVAAGAVMNRAAISLAVVLAANAKPMEVVGAVMSRAATNQARV